MKINSQSHPATDFCLTIYDGNDFSNEDAWSWSEKTESAITELQTSAQHRGTSGSFLFVS